MTDAIEKTKKPRGFAAMSKEKRLAVAQLGGRSVPPEKRSFSTNRALASEAGTKGGVNVPAESRSFSRNPELAQKAGQKGGRGRREKPNG